MKSMVALVFAFALVTLLPTSANATTLEITRGTVVLSQELGSQMSFSGIGFVVFATEEPGCCGDLSRAFGVEPFVLSDVLVSSPSSLVDIRVGNQTCRGSINPFVSCGDITLTSPGFAIPPDWPINIPFVATVSFTATGQLLVGGEAFDMVGHGTVTGTRCLSAPQAPCLGGVRDRSEIVYTFVSEPPTLWLMLVSAMTIGIGFAHRSVVNVCLRGLAEWRQMRAMNS